MSYLGCHVSMKAPKYLEGSIQEALSYGANACMVYTGPPSNSKRVEVSKLHIEQASELMKESGLSFDHLIIHAPYIINIGNCVRKETFEFGVEFLQEELRRVAAIGAKIVVLHPGSHVNGGVDNGLSSIIDGLNQVLNNDDSNVCIALETMAGKGSEMGRSFEELAYIRNHVDRKDRIKVCLDTCHIHDAGYDLSKFDDILDEFDQVIGLENLAVLHINDSKNPMGAHKDRHANIGDGYIGFDILYSIVHNPRIAHLPMILETPYIDDKAPYKEEIERLRG